MVLVQGAVWGAGTGCYAGCCVGYCGGAVQGAVRGAGTGCCVGYCVGCLYRVLCGVLVRPCLLHLSSNFTFLISEAGDKLYTVRWKNTLVQCLRTAA